MVVTGCNEEKKKLKKRQKKTKIFFESQQTAALVLHSKQARKQQQQPFKLCANVLHIYFSKATFPLRLKPELCTQQSIPHIHLIDVTCS